MEICIVGTGYVGLSASVGFASKGNSVTCVDIDKEKVEKINQGEPPIYEKGMEKLLNEALDQELLKATTDLETAVEKATIIFITVGTPMKEDGSIDLSKVKQAAEDVGKALKEKDDYTVVTVKSTVVPRTTRDEIIPILEKKSGKDAGKDFGVCMNPEFLREGKALSDFLDPDRIVIGELDEKSGKLLENLCKDFDSPILRMGLSSAEMVKYASNSFLANKISFINEIGNICKKLEIDVYEVAEAMGHDERISPRFLRAGAGYGGSCFPKDVRALIAKSKDISYEPELLESGVSLNEDQPLKMLELLKEHLGGLEGKTVGVLGLAFKPGTDDIRESPALDVVNVLLEENVEVKAYDPKAMDNFRERFPDVEYCDSAEEVLDSDAALILTDWGEFGDLDYSGKVIIDGRRLEKAEEEADVYEGICW
ncbi:UDP-glucose 6-dehydrogenase [candidate division MSBL1 archaeon SCGC-AAA382C18]|uniref:UDP-glucose 6-dehydrogenase n=1 Tax=candidate division MSBL1 archaeon SCGC-AAA382C18 TaxID=1698281 RepID=A0A133VL74_9EURY|nr:UDP-glucose 6-dehydrogenase [candidate division MSBL1 archaeon SCGC-AAA382C18]